MIMRGKVNMQLVKIKNYIFRNFKNDVPRILIDKIWKGVRKLTH